MLLGIICAILRKRTMKEKRETRLLAFAGEVIFSRDHVHSVATARTGGAPRNSATCNPASRNSLIAREEGQKKPRIKIRIVSVASTICTMTVSISRRTSLPVASAIDVMLPQSGGGGVLVPVLKVNDDCFNSQIRYPNPHTTSCKSFNPTSPANYETCVVSPADSPNLILHSYKTSPSADKYSPQSKYSPIENLQLFQNVFLKHKHRR
jgi:hypothetical protein